MSKSEVQKQPSKDPQKTAIFNFLKDFYKDRPKKNTFVKRDLLLYYLVSFQGLHFRI
jgi:hypothetical protein